MKGHNPHAARSSYKIFDTISHLGSGLVGKSDSKYAVRIHALLYHVGNAVSHGRSLT
jgi:hypothetical protein